MEHIPLLAKGGAKREPDRAKPQEKPRHQKNTPVPKRRGRGGQFGEIFRP